ncbi:MAG: hypothetical protein PHV06_07450 [bacterium]|nr:hypothetical protein [bacterium]
MTKTKFRTLLIDDKKTHIRTDRVCRTFEEGIEALTGEGPWNTLYLDFDLDDKGSPPRNGMSILEFLNNNPEYIPDEIIPISASSSYNSLLSEKIRLIMKKKVY